MADAMTALRSPANATDAVMMGKEGAVSQGQTLGQALEAMWGIPMDTPVEQAIPALKEKLGNADMATKMQKMGGGMPQGAPQGAPPQGPPPGAAPAGLGAMAQRMRG
jgi:hypothetical protein